MMSQPLCYFLIQNEVISGSSSISIDNFGAINNWKKLNGRDSLNVRAESTKCGISGSRIPRKEFESEEG